MKSDRRHEMGEGGCCTCPKCEKVMPHSQGIPCQDEKCPKCGSKMIREGSYHHDLLMKKREGNSEKG